MILTTSPGPTPIVWGATVNNTGKQTPLDAVHAFEDHRALHILEELAVEVQGLGTLMNRELVLVAESDLNDPRLVSSREAGGFGLAAQWSDDFHHAVHAAITAERQGYFGDFGSMGALVKGGWKPDPQAQNMIQTSGEFFMVDESEVLDVQAQMLAQYLAFH